MRRVLLLGMGPTALSALGSLARQFLVLGIVRSGGTDDEADDIVIRRASELSVPVLSDTSLIGVRQAIEDLRPECTVVSSYNRILSPAVLQHGKFVNVHYAPLPRYRGRANVNWAILNGEPETAITIHEIAPGLDNGNILFQKNIPIGPDDTVSDVYDALNEIQDRALGETVERYLDGFPGASQNESESTYGCSRVPADGEIDWSQSTERIYALIRALSQPYPGAYSYLGSRHITIVRASPVREGPRYVGRIPGRVVGTSRLGGYVDVLTGNGTLRVHDVIVDGAEGVMAASVVITSTRQTLGLRNSDLMVRIAELERRLNVLEEK